MRVWWRRLRLIIYIKKWDFGKVWRVGVRVVVVVSVRLIGVDSAVVRNISKVHLFYAR